MADNAPIDQNDVKGLIAASSVDGKTPVKVYADPTTHRLLVDSSGTGGVVYYTPTGNVDASNSTFGVTGEPSSVVSDGVVYFDGYGYTYSSLQITMTIPPSEYIKYTL